MTVLTFHPQNNRWETEAPAENDCRGCAAALGNFDGVHVGHRALLRESVRFAEENSLIPAVWTFSALPFPEKNKQLCTSGERLALFAQAGIRRVFLEDFSAVQSVSPQEFVTRILLGACRAEMIVCGFNYRFGADAAGTPETLSELLSGTGTALSVLPPIKSGESVVSSTRVRALLQQGSMEEAAACLGRLYSFCFPVVHGKELGRTLGFPTVNQELPTSLALPAPGTYATAVMIGGIPYPAVTNIGTRPSIAENDDHLPNAETHIIGYSGWLYGTDVRVYFRYRLRDERRFPSLSALEEQIKRDSAASGSDFSKETFCPFPESDVLW